MRERIYYIDPACRQFAATVARALTHEGHPAVVLDRTAFYPTSGGQPYDTGTLGSSRVVDVIDQGDDIVHVLDMPIEVGSLVTGTIDWARRQDHMQQHSGQHVLSAAFARVCENPTVSVHIGATTCSIDLAREVSAADIERAEAEANEVVLRDEPVSIRFVSAAEALRLSLRKESARTGTLRLIDIPGVDLSACGGTHVARTGAIGLIAVLGSERFKGGTRVTFACGLRARHAFRGLRDAMAASTRLLSVLPEDLPEALRRLQDDAKEQRRQMTALRETLAGYEAEAWLEGAQQLGPFRVIVRVMEGADVPALKTMASALSGTPGTTVVLLTADAPFQVVVARASDVPLDAGALLRTLTEQYGGKGGGRPELAQGGGLHGDVRQVLWTASGLVEAALGR